MKSLSMGLFNKGEHISLEIYKSAWLIWWENTIGSNRRRGKDGMKCRYMKRLELLGILRRGCCDEMPRAWYRDEQKAQRKREKSIRLSALSYISAFDIIIDWRSTVRGGTYISIPGALSRAQRWIQFLQFGMRHFDKDNLKPNDNLRSENFRSA